MRITTTGQRHAATGLQPGSLDGLTTTEASLAPARPLRLLLPLAFIVVTAICVFQGSLAIERPGAIGWDALALSAWLTTLFLLLFSRAKYFGIFEMRLGSWFIAYAVLAFGLATITLTQPQTGSAAAVDPSKIPIALLLIGISFAFWALGYVLGSAHILQRPFRWGASVLTSRLSREVRSPIWLIVVFGAGIAADLLVIILEGRYGYLGDASVVTIDSVSWYTQPLAIVSSMKDVALFGLSVRVYVTRQDSAIKFLLPTLAISLLLGLLSGTKEAFITTLLSAGIPYFLGRSRRRLLAIVLAVIVFVFVVAPTISELRQEVRGGGGSLSIGSALSIGLEQILSPPPTFGVSDGSTNAIGAIERIRLVDNVAIIVDKTPGEIPYRSPGELVSAAFTGFVPRAIWPDKPVRISGLDFYRTYYGGTANSSSAITLEGSLYMYGGEWILFIGMLAVGIAIRALDDVLVARYSLSGALFFVILAPIIVKQELDVAGFLAGVITFVITWFLGVHLIFRRARLAVDGEGNA